jgi:L-amino acid N-acyltransferase YncA
VSFELEPPTADEMAARIRAARVWLVAERDGRVVGYAYGGQHRAREAYNPTVEVSAYVDQSVHRAGVGRELYLALFDRLKQGGARLLVAGITLPNDASVAFHQALGFSRVGVFKSIGRKFGQWWDVAWWQLDLGEPVTNVNTR